MARYIDADKVLFKIQYRERTYGCFTKMYSKVIKDAPTADVRPERHGAWKRVSDDDQDEGCYFCSECKEDFSYAVDDDDLLPNFCPNCGAKMDGKSGESDE